MYKNDKEYGYEYYFNQGKKYYINQKYSKALGSFTKAIELNPEDIASYNYRGLTYIENQDYKKAIADYNKAIGLDLENSNLYNNRGIAYKNIKEYGKAIADYDKAIELDPNDADLYMNRGLAYEEEKKYDRAIEDYNKAIELNSKDYNLYRIRGSAYDEKKEYSKALADYSKAIELNADDAETYNNRAIAYKNNEEYIKAIADYTKSIELKSDDDWRYINRGLAYYAIQDYDNAIADYGRAIELNHNSSEAYNCRGIAYDEIQDYDRAIEDYTKAIELQPLDNKAYNNRNLSYKKKQEFDKAIDDQAKVNGLNPSNAEFYNKRATFYKKKREYDKAIAEYTKAIELNPDYAEIYNKRGISYKKKQEYDKAIVDYTKAIELKPNYSKAYHNRGVAHYHKQEYDKAIADYDKAIELEDDYALAYLNKAYLLKEIGEYEKAYSYFELANQLYLKTSDNYRLKKISNSLNELSEYIEAKKQNESMFTLMLNQTKDIFYNSEIKKRSFLNFIKPKKLDDNENYLEVLRRWNSYTPIVADNFHISKGGGYFIRINGKGIVVDPGFNFIENFKGHRHSFNEIDIVLISHAHNDHTADLESIITLLHKYNENIKSSENPEDTYTIEYELADRLGEKWTNYTDREKTEAINKEFIKSSKRKIIDIFLTSGTFKKFAGMLQLNGEVDYNVHTIEADYKKEFKESSFTVSAIKASHYDIISNSSSVGFLIEFKDNCIFYTGDTGVNEEIVKLYNEAAHRISGKNLILLAHLGGFKDYEEKYQEKDRFKYFYKNHLGRLGLIEVNNILKPKICLISEFGEEFKDNRIEFSEIMANLYNQEIKFLPADIGLKLIFKDSVKVYGISDIDMESYKVNKDDIEPNDTAICLLRKDYSLHYYNKQANLKEGDIIQVLIEEYNNSNR